jgi:hypothetical protein
MYARITKSMFKLLEDGSRESIVAKAIAQAFAYEGNIGLIGGP